MDIDNSSTVDLYGHRQFINSRFIWTSTIHQQSIYMDIDNSSTVDLYGHTIIYLAKLDRKTTTYARTALITLIGQFMR
jgi:hypothetical protein